ncbi:MAG TPA: helix-turn-helix transcriptional regulator [Solirubrobacterales bacterium]|nr:helix-turn-helix transcriptional regulator [Solirubrobacterales bacterium]
MDIGMRFGANLNTVRRASGISQERLAIKAGLHRTEIGLLEHGRRVPRIDTVAKLARALDVGPGELLIGITANPEPKSHISQGQSLNRGIEVQDQRQARQIE